jgi:hypothetical protein
MAHVNLRRFEKQDTPFPLGRHVYHDSRSRSFTFQVPATPIVHNTIIWPHSTPILNQGQKFSCTGNAAAQLLNCDLFAPARATVKALPEGDPSNWLTEGDALQLYGLGTHLDGFGADQYYPPNDDGGSGLGVAKALQQLGYVDSYTHCYTFTQFQAAIQTQPVLMGTSWTNSMFTPDPVTGRITVGLLNDQTVVGGHEWVGLGIDYQTQDVVGLQSWGDWGGGTGLNVGMFKISFAEFANLLADEGDIVVPHVVGTSG